jgi:hypothetical protein
MKAQMRSREVLGLACGFREVITPVSPSLAARKGALESLQIGLAGRGGECAPSS